jgi:hypothetical protein
LFFEYAQMSQIVDFAEQLRPTLCAVLGINATAVIRFAVA